MTLARPSRRTLVAAIALGAAGAGAARAQTYPDRPLRVVVPFGPGGLADVTMRIVGEAMAKRLGQQVVIVNQPGANGVTAARAVLSAAADGYTLALLTNGTAVTTALARQPPFDALTAFAPVAGLGTFAFLVLTAPASGYASLDAALKVARAKPGTLNIGGISVGSTQNLTVSLLKVAAGIDAAVVAYRTTPDVVTALLRNDIQLAVDGYVAAKSLLADGKLTALATTGTTRARLLPQVPTTRELGLDVEAVSWNGLFVKAGAPAAVVERLNDVINAALAEPDVRSKLIDLGIEPSGGTPADIGSRLSRDIATWSAIVDRAGIQRQ